MLLGSNLDLKADLWHVHCTKAHQNVLVRFHIVERLSVVPTTYLDSIYNARKKGLYNDAP